MAVVVALLSQKGGVGKSTLARGLGAICAHAGLKVRIADLDPQQQTVMRWQEARKASAVAPLLDVRAYRSLEDALEDADDVELLVLDAPGHASQATLSLARSAHLVVQPTGPGLDDLYPGVLLFHELTREGVPGDRLVFALCRTQTKKEEDGARAYLQEAGYRVLPGALPERAGYREAQNRGQAVTETSKKELNDRADALMIALVERIAVEVKAISKAAKSDAKTKQRGSA